MSEFLIDPKVYDRWYVVRRGCDGAFVQVDHSSGGYPYYLEDPRTATAWGTRREAQNYADMFKDDKLFVHQARVQFFG